MNKKIIKLVKHPGRYLKFGVSLLLQKFGVILSDETYIRWTYRLAFGKKLDLSNPRTYNEKIQWLKLYDRNPDYTIMVDKILAKEYVASVIGDEHIIPTIATYDSADEIDFDALPDQFALKCNHGCGDMCICRDKSKIDFDKVRKSLAKGLLRDYYSLWREWPYKNVKHRILAEQYMVDESGYELKDYKFFCFDGKPEFMFIASDRYKQGEETKFDFFDMDFNHLPFTNGHPNSDKKIMKPASFEKMKEIASKLSKGIPHVRIDLYDINGKIYFGEMTFSHWSGFVPFEPEEWDYKFGEFIQLPSIKKQ